jgi:DNA-directed RNA polymerase specialized sigma24 family protein
VSLLGRTWRLHDVEDVEALACKALDDTLRKGGAYLRPDQRDDCLAFLLATAWELSERWEPGRGGVSFATYCYRTLRLRVVDWHRQEYGRTRWKFAHGTHVRDRPDVLSLDADHPGRDRLDASLSSREGDLADDRSPDLTRMLRGEVASALRTSTSWVSSRLYELGLEIERGS